MSFRLTHTKKIIPISVKLCIINMVYLSNGDTNIYWLWVVAASIAMLTKLITKISIVYLS